MYRMENLSIEATFTLDTPLTDVIDWYSGQPQWTLTKVTISVHREGHVCTLYGFRQNRPTQKTARQFYAKDDRVEAMLSEMLRNMPTLTPMPA